MKKNKMMRLASALLVAVLLTTSVISGTYAKYTTSDSAQDTAKVAKWGVVVTAGGEDLFVKKYDNESTPSVHSELNDTLAPGTANSEGVTFAISGKPEVKVKVNIAMVANKDVFLNEGTYLDPTTGEPLDVKAFSGKYTPVKYTLIRTTYVDGVAQTPSTLVDGGTLENVVTALNVSNAEHNPNTDLASVYGTYKLTWAWDFPTTPNDVTDFKDTLLGNLIAGQTAIVPQYDSETPPNVIGGTNIATDAYSTDINFSVNISVEQVD